MPIKRLQRRASIAISAWRFELAVYQGAELTDHRAYTPEEASAETDWQTTLEAFESCARAWVEELGLAGTPVTVVYTDHDTAATISSCPAAAGPARAALAARLALADTVSFPLESNCNADRVVFRDAGGPDAAPRLHTLAAADTESALGALAVAMGRLGLRSARFIPAPALALASAVRSAGSAGASDAPRVVLWLGDQAGAIACVSDGALAFARPMPVGVESIVEALTGHASGDSALLDRCGARELLFESGIPSADGWARGTPALDPLTVLPLIQPVLQRLVIEVKQSVRFGLGAEQRDAVGFELAGPGAGVLNLARTLGVAASLELAGDPAPSPTDDRPDLRGDLGHIGHAGELVPALEPRRAAERRARRASTQAVLAGSALALLAIGLDASESHLRQSAAEQTLSSLRADLGPEAAAARAEADAALARVGALRDAERRIDATLPERAPMAALLAEIARRTPEGVELSDVDVRSQGPGVECVLTGIVRSDRSGSEAERFNAFAERLRESPLVATTRLGDTRRLLEGGSPALGFAITLDLVTLPQRGAALASWSGDETGGTP